MAKKRRKVRLQETKRLSMADIEQMVKTLRKIAPLRDVHERTLLVLLALMMSGGAFLDEVLTSIVQASIADAAFREMKKRRK